MRCAPNPRTSRPPGEFPVGDPFMSTSSSTRTSAWIRDTARAYAGQGDAAHHKEYLEEKPDREIFNEMV